MKFSILMETYIISDTHFNHKSMILQKWRHFKTVLGMNEYIIKMWNKTVGKDDLVYHLGDVALGGYTQYLEEIEPRLNGKIVYIKGNHDSNSLTPIQSLIIREKGINVELVHNPAEATGKCEFVIHGHHHHKQEEFERVKGLRYFCVSLDFNKFKPYLLRDALGRMKKPKDL